VERLRSNDKVEKGKVTDLHDFFVNFVDACHHGKEEQYYFPVALVALPELKETAATLKLDHDIGKALLRGIARALELWEDKEDLARRQAADNLAAYTALLQRHVDVESREMMKPAASAFSQEQQELVREGFHYVESEELGDGFHQKYHTLAMKILGEKHS
ncbi:MAG TPA: hemerythrin domain-containing protein, partial [Desulfopila sp.]|nr:hemerythrin domain-containing protein [Desulfopila sp.]